MRKEKTLFIVGLWVILLPFLGFPNSWRSVLFVFTGIAIMYLAYLFYLDFKSRLADTFEHSKTFTDNIVKE